MNFQTAIRACLGNYATFAGRARRSEFWFFALFTILCNIVASILDGALFGIQGGGPLGVIVSLGLFLPGLAAGARRLHDGGRSGWWLLIGLLPILGWIVLLIFYLNRGEDGPNRFGGDPREAIAMPGTPASLNRPWTRP
jgi:uncharacterized membrane protein YhaH (DUF805 family)